MAESKLTTPPRPSGALPSSFDSNPEFFEESRSAKLWRRLKEEPLIPLGCAATCYALYQALRSMQKGDHNRVNRMFRARIYAQGFTLIAMVGGSIFYKDERLKTKELEKAIQQKKAAENKEKWLKELEARDQEDREWRSKFEGVAQRAKAAEDRAKSQSASLTARLLHRARQGEEAAAEKVAADEAKQPTDRKAGLKVEKGKEDSSQREKKVEGVDKPGDSAGKEKEQAFQTKSILEQFGGDPRKTA